MLTSAPETAATTPRLVSFIPTSMMLSTWWGSGLGLELGSLVRVRVGVRVRVRVGVRVGVGARVRVGVRVRVRVRVRVGVRVRVRARCLAHHGEGDRLA